MIYTTVRRGICTPGIQCVQALCICLALLISSSLLIPSESFSEQSAEKKIYVENFRVFGNKIFKSDKIISRLDKVKGKEYTLQELKRLTDIITNMYHKEGYILARAYIPQQEITDNIVLIAIAEGELGDVEVSAGNYYYESYIKGWFKHLRGKAVKEKEVERAILLANDTPSLNVTTVLKKGSQPGTADIAVKAKDSYPVKLSVDYDNHGNPLVSRDRFGVNLQLTDPIIGSTLSVRAITGSSLDDSFYGGIDFHMPLNHRGTRFGARYINADYLVGDDLGILGIEGESRIIGGYISHQLIRSSYVNLKAAVGFDYKHMFEFIFSSQRSNDDLSVAYFKMDYDRLDRIFGRRGKHFLSASYSRGFNKLFGALDDGDSVASRAGASGRFDKITADYARVQQLSDQVILLLKSSGQLSFNNLVVTEQFSIGGADTVRGHQLSTHTGDHGYLLTAELHMPLPFIGHKTISDRKISDLFQAVVFTDHGGVFLIDPLVGESKNDYLSSVGFGARLHLFDWADLTLDVGYPFEDGEIRKNDEIVYIKGTVYILAF